VVAVVVQVLSEAMHRVRVLVVTAEMDQPLQELPTLAAAAAQHLLGLQTAVLAAVVAAGVDAVTLAQRFQALQTLEAVAVAAMTLERRPQEEAAS
jgi:hypothetical protein